MQSACEEFVSPFWMTRDGVLEVDDWMRKVCFVILIPWEAWRSFGVKRLDGRDQNANIFRETVRSSRRREGHRSLLQIDRCHVPQNALTRCKRHPSFCWPTISLSPRLPFSIFRLCAPNEVATCKIGNLKPFITPHAAKPP